MTIRRAIDARLLEQARIAVVVDRIVLRRTFQRKRVSHVVWR